MADGLYWQDDIHPRATLDNRFQDTTDRSRVSCEFIAVGFAACSVRIVFLLLRAMNSLLIARERVGEPSFCRDRFSEGKSRLRSIFLSHSLALSLSSSVQADVIHVSIIYGALEREATISPASKTR